MSDVDILWLLREELDEHMEEFYTGVQESEHMPEIEAIYRGEVAVWRELMANEGYEVWQGESVVEEIPF